jgi:uncharacterized protein
VTLSSHARTLLTPLLPLLQWRDARRIVTRHVHIPGAHGARLALVSDLHARDDWFPVGHVRSVVERVNELEDIDAVLLLGDFVGDDVTAIDWAAPELARIVAPTYAVLGNHDHWTDPERIARELERAGVDMLTNRSVELGAHDLWLAGIDSCWGGDPDPERAFAEVPAGVDTVVLGHEPHLATLHDRYLHVAGHTHHGQVRTPLFGEFVARRNYVRFSQPYPRGLYARGEHSFVYTTGGVGYSTVSFRVSCPPEIVVLTC